MNRIDRTPHSRGSAAHPGKAGVIDTLRVQRWLDLARIKANAGIDRLPGKFGELARKANHALGRPLADSEELADRRAFAAQSGPLPAGSAQRSHVAAPAPVIVYHMDKTRRDAAKLIEILNAHSVPHQVANIEDDPAAQAAIRRDSRGIRLPVVFIAGECLGGREQLVNAVSSGDLEKKVFG